MIARGNRLYLKLYAAFLGVLLAVMAVTFAINMATGHAFALIRGGPRLANHLARMMDRPDPPQRIVDDMHDELGVDVSVFGPDGEVLANAGSPIPAPDRARIDQRGPGWLGRGLVGAPLRRIPGAVVVARLPMAEGNISRIALRTVLLLVGTLLVSFLLVYPLSRSITRPLEKLTAAVQAYGRGDVSQRSGLVDLQDEVGELARSFDEMADRIQAARRTEKELLANVSHELRTPLARMKIALELIQPKDDAVRNRLGALNEEVDELDRLIADVLTASRLDLASLPLRRVKLQVHEVIDKARLRALALQPSLAIAEHVEPGLIVEADEALLTRAVENLIDNARKYGNGSGLEVAARRDGGQVAIAVRDHGPGIPEGELPHVFDPFFRGEGARGRATGFGLGLALARRVAEAHGGSAQASNAEGGGARIELRLPLQSS